MTWRALLTAVVLGGLAQSVAGSGSALLATRLAGGESAAGLPQAMLVIGAGLGSLLLSWATARLGRLRSLAIGVGSAMVGATLVLTASQAATGALTGLLAGSVLMGAGNASVMLARYAGTELAPPVAPVIPPPPTAAGTPPAATAAGAPPAAIEQGAAPAAIGPGAASAAAGPGVAPALDGSGTAVTVRRDPARTMAVVLMATTVGTLIGPNLLAPADALGRSLGLAPLTGGYGIAAVSYLAAVIVLLLGAGRGRPVRTIVRGRTHRPWTRPARAGLGVLAVSNTVMVVMMTVIPVHLHAHGGGLAVVGWVISVHIAGMYLPATLTARLLERFGAPAVSVAGSAVLMAACLLAAVATGAGLLAIAMALLGVGWNFGLLGGSRLLTDGLPPELAPRREGMGDAGVTFVAAGGGAAAGPLLATAGFPLLAALAAVVAAFAAVTVRHLALDRQSAIPGPARAPGRETQ